MSEKRFSLIIYLQVSIDTPVPLDSNEDEHVAYAISRITNCLTTGWPRLIMNKPPRIEVVKDTNETSKR